MSTFVDETPWTTELEELRARNLYRVMPVVSGLPGRTIQVNGHEALNFSGNNYLSLAAHPDIIQAYALGAERYGAGSTASRLIAGNGESHRELEAFIARWKGTEAAVAFVSGYQANVGILTAMTGCEDLIVSDELNHASIIDGCRLSRAKVAVYPHLDLNRMEDLVQGNGFRRTLVVTESVFSMDGHRSPLREISAICRRHGAFLMVDEAHATGVFGQQGQGWASQQGVMPDIQMGTLGKAVGTSGAYAAGSRPLMEILINRARSLIYTTAAPPAVVCSALAALKLISSEEGERRRAALEENTITFNELLKSIPGHVSAVSHIVPVLVGDSARALRMSRACLEGGVFAQAIRYPTVPEGTARLRFTLMSSHTRADLQKAVSVLKTALDQEEP